MEKILIFSFTANFVLLLILIFESIKKSQLKKEIIWRDEALEFKNKTLRPMPAPQKEIKRFTEAAQKRFLKNHTGSELAKYFGVTNAAIYQWRRAGKIPEARIERARELWLKK